MGKLTSRDKESEALLQHEQLHFDIVELVARQLKKELKELKKKGALKPEDIYNIYRKYRAKLSELQDRYDDETYYSNLKEKQLEWNDKIEKELALYKDYYEVDIELFLNQK